MELVSSAENSSLDWKAQYKYIEDIGDGRGYTGRHHRLLLRHRRHARARRGLHQARSRATCWPSTCPRCSRSTAPTRTPAWARPTSRHWHDGRQGHGVPAGAGRRARPRLLQPVGQPGQVGRPARARASSSTTTRSSCTAPATTRDSFGGIRKTAMKKAKTPAQGGNETTYLNAFLDARKAAMKTRRPTPTRAASTPSSASSCNGNLDLNTPLNWKIYGDPYRID